MLTYKYNDINIFNKNRKIILLKHAIKNIK